MPFPNFEGKHAHDALVTARDLREYRRKLGRRNEVEAPQGVVICYQQSLMDHVRAVEAIDAQSFSAGELYLLERTHGRVGVVGRFGIGAPVAAIVVEDLIALGSTTFINIGTAGALQRELGIGNVVVCTQAIRDEDVSHHYLAPAQFAGPSATLTERLRTALAGAEIAYVAGPTWTIDTPYRETVEEARHYQREGVQTVEMEAAAVFAVAEHRHVAAAAAFVISDSLAELVWEPQFAAPSVGASLERLFGAAVTALAED